jgi:aspartyl-tRNA synthetase
VIAKNRQLLKTVMERQGFTEIETPMLIASTRPGMR